MTSIVANRIMLTAIVMAPRENVAIRPHIWRRFSCSWRSRGNGSTQTSKNHQPYVPVDVTTCKDLLSTSVRIFIAQSTLNTTLESNVLQAPSSSDQLTDTCRPHQKVSKKQVVIIADAVNIDTAKSNFLSHGIVGGKRRKYSARMASFGR